MDDLTTALVQGDRRALSRAITLIESTRADHRARALALLSDLPGRQALRIGLSGTPGVGKSTFIEAFGKMLTGQGLRVAVLAVDPSSVRSGGSILGDKTRMEMLARDPMAFIRPSPSRAELGGVGRRTRETVRLAEAIPTTGGLTLELVELEGRSVARGPQGRRGKPPRRRDAQNAKAGEARARKLRRIRKR